MPIHILIADTLHRLLTDRFVEPEVWGKIDYNEMKEIAEFLSGKLSFSEKEQKPTSKLFQK